MNQELIGNRLRTLRGKRPRAEVCDYLGVSENALYNWERGYRSPSDSMKVKIAFYYGKTVQELFFDGAE